VRTIDLYLKEVRTFVLEPPWRRLTKLLRKFGCDALNGSERLRSSFDREAEIHQELRRR
jgi:hypothetical protein